MCFEKFTDGRQVYTCKQCLIHVHQSCSHIREKFHDDNGRVIAPPNWCCCKCEVEFNVRYALVFLQCLWTLKKSWGSYCEYCLTTSWLGSLHDHDRFFILQILSISPPCIVQFLLRLLILTKRLWDNKSIHFIHIFFIKSQKSWEDWWWRRLQILSLFL